MVKACTARIARILRGRGGIAPWGGWSGLMQARLSLGTVLALSFGALLVLSVGSILAISVRANFVNTISLLDARAVSLIEGMEQQVAAEAGQAERAAKALAELFAAGRLDNAGEAQSGTVLLALLESAPTVEGIVIYRKPDGIVSLFRQGDNYARLPQGSSEHQLDAIMQRAYPSIGTNAAWGRPAPIGDSLFHHLAFPLVRNGEPVGMAMAFVGQNMVSQVMGRIEPGSGATVFLLAETGEVLGHSARRENIGGYATQRTESFPDPVLRQLAVSSENSDFAQAARSGIQVLSTPDRQHVFLTKKLAGYSAEPMLLGVHFPAAALSTELWRAATSLLIGLAGLAVAVVAAVVLGRRISRPMTQVANVASLFSQFRLAEIMPLERSRIKEIDDQAQALNKMRTTLLQFTRYVPRELVARLMRTGEHANEPLERDVTIIFSDIIGFTKLSESMNAVEVAQLLNRHFELVTSKVEATGGTVDKFMGDGVMAFWGAPEADSDHAAHAVEAARLIAMSVHADNAERRMQGKPPLQVRMGIHSGKVVVGNIGSRERHNYTVVGDTVNVAQRLEQLGKDLIGKDDIIVLVSRQMAEAVGDKARCEPLGTKTIRGRKGPVEIARLWFDHPAPSRPAPAHDRPPCMAG